jgi:NADH-ubiquinone oxidoreductase chain 5
LHTWLPDAMEGPTPVSALIHAATMVTAGVFLRARCSPLLEYAPVARQVITRRGAFTAFFAGTVGLVQNDRKRVIAYSTCSQLGYMVFACGLSAYAVGVFHLANHAVFKALRFLCAGSVIHARGDDQDIRRMGGLVRVLPRTYARMRIGSRARMGFPFRTGFYSKDVILEVAYGTYETKGHVAYVLGTLAAACTAYYSMRLLYLTFLAEAAGYKKVYEHAHDAPRRMALPLRRLGAGSIGVGWLGKDLRIGLGTPFWGQALYTHWQHRTRIDAEFRPHTYKLLPVTRARTSATVAFVRYDRASAWVHATKLGIGRGRYVFRSKKWFFDKVYTEWRVQPALHHAYHTTYRAVDRGRIERLGPHGRSQRATRSAGTRRDRHRGNVYHHRTRMRVGRRALRAVARS